jgi:hypothetical protein
MMADSASIVELRTKLVGRALRMCLGMVIEVLAIGPLPDRAAARSATAATQWCSSSATAQRLINFGLVASSPPRRALSAAVGSLVGPQ